MSLWESIKGGQERTAFEADLRQHPQGYFAEIASSRIGQLELAAPSPVVAAKPEAVSSSQTAATQSGSPSAAEQVLELPLEAISANTVPRPGDWWTYTHLDGFRRSVVGVMTYRIDWVNREGIGEFLSVPGRPSSFDTVVLTAEGFTYGADRQESLITIWYAPVAKRFVKFATRTGMLGRLDEYSVFELVEYQLRQ